MHQQLRAAAVTGLSALLTAGTAAAFVLYPANGFLGYTYNKWGDPAVGTGAVVYWSLIAPGTGGSDYCQPACPGSSTLTLPNFYDWNSHTFSAVQLSDPVLLGYIQNAFNAWAKAANVTFRYLPNDAGVAINDPTAEPPTTGNIRIGVFNPGFTGPAAVGYAPPPNGFIPNSSQLATGAGDILFNSQYAYQNPAGNEGDPLAAFPLGGGPFLNDFQGLILHEIGHALGMDHTNVADAVMCGFPNSCTFDNVSTYAINRALNPDDVAGIRTIYGAAPDTDIDGVVDSLDNCRLVANANQRDADGDGYGNFCDADLNNSGLVTSADFAVLRSVLNQSASASPTAAAADMNGSGTVTTADFGLLRARLGTVPGPSGFVP